MHTAYLSSKFNLAHMIEYIWPSFHIIKIISSYFCKYRYRKMLRDLLIDIERNTGIYIIKKNAIIVNKKRYENSIYESISNL